MDLPDDSIGISDINTWRDCPTRAEYSMRRWTEGSEPPERKHPDIMYGSAIHHGIEMMEKDVLSADEAAQAAFDEYGMYLDPEDMLRLEKDLATYAERDYRGVRVVALEGEYRVPLLVHEGRQIYYRFKLDRLYEYIDRPGHFLHVDYKSSKWYKTAKEIREDTQMWSYNWGIHEFFPECERLDQIYDQLMYGREQTQKNDEQRKVIRRWLQRQVRAILNDENPQPKFNDWCPWCPLLPDCPEPKRTAQFAAARIAALAPDPDGGDKVVLDPDLIGHYIAELPEISKAKKALETFEEAVRKVIKELPEGVRTYHGYEAFGKKGSVWSPIALREAADIMGDDFYALVKMTKTAVNDFLPKDDPRRQQILDLAESTEVPQVRRMSE